MKRNRKTLKKTLSIMLSAVMLVSAMAFMPDNALEAEAEATTKDVTITKGSNMTKTTTSGAESQTGLTGAMSVVVYSPDKGYYFPYSYIESIAGIEAVVREPANNIITGTINGISITQAGTYQIIVLGTPTATTAITLPNAKAMGNQSAPEGVSGGIDQIVGTATNMEYASSADADDESWTRCSKDNTAVTAGTWYVRYTVTVTDNASPSVRVIVTTAPTAPAITTNSLPNGSVNTAYSQTLAATGSGTITWSAISGSLPDGLSLGSDGAISGTPTTTGTFSFTVQAANGTQPNATMALSIVIEDEAASTYDVTVTKGSNMTKTDDSGAASQTGLTDAMTDVVYTADSGYYFPDSYSVSEVTGISVTRNSASQITVSGTPTATTAITLTDATAKAAQNAPTGLSDGIDKIAGTTAAMEYATSADASSWNPCSNSNTTVAAGTWYVRYKETDTQKAGASVSVTVTAAAVSDAPTITTNSLPNGSVNTAYSQTLAATGSGTITWSAISGRLPDGLSLDSDGVISGTPTTTGTFSFKVQASNGTPPDATKSLSIEIEDEEAHSFGEWIIDTEATTTTEGTKHRVCSVCGYRENGTISKKDDGGSSGGSETPAAVTATKDKSARRDTKAYKEWAWSISKDNPDNYLEKIKDSSGKEIVSGVPTHTTSKNGSILIVSQKLEDAEKTFEKSDAKNQIVVKMNEIQCGLEMKKVFESNAAAQGAKLQSTFEIKAEERTKKEYQHVRDITSVTNPVTYTLLLPESMGDMAGKTVSILQYSDDGSTVLLDDMDTDSKMITFVTKNPSGTFAVIVK